MDSPAALSPDTVAIVGAIGDLLIALLFVAGVLLSVVAHSAWGKWHQ